VSEFSLIFSFGENLKGKFSFQLYLQLVPPMSQIFSPHCYLFFLCFNPSFNFFFSILTLSKMGLKAPGGEGGIFFFIFLIFFSLVKFYVVLKDFRTRLKNSICKLILKKELRNVHGKLMCKRMFYKGIYNQEVS
jgi:hypothetical protein